MAEEHKDENIEIEQGERKGARPARTLPARTVDAHPVRWLSLKEASDFLGIHFTTLRAWADRGELRVFRTPGGHRRFSSDDLRRFLEERAGQMSATNAASVVDAALVRVRKELDRTVPGQEGWREHFRSEPDEARQQRGRQLLALALAYVMRPAQHEQVLRDGRQLGNEYGRETAQHGVSLAETGRAVQFFRGHLVEVVRSRDAGGVMDADDQRIQQLIDQFLDEVLYAVLAGYEEQLATMALANR